MCDQSTICPDGNICSIVVCWNIAAAHESLFVASECGSRGVDSGCGLYQYIESTLNEVGASPGSDDEADAAPSSLRRKNRLQRPNRATSAATCAGHRSTPICAGYR